jgi:hypothetical protein
MFAEGSSERPHTRRRWQGAPAREGLAHPGKIDKDAPKLEDDAPLRV